MLLIATSSSRAPCSKEHRDHSGHGKDRNGKENVKACRVGGRERSLKKDDGLRKQNALAKAKSTLSQKSKGSSQFRREEHVPLRPPALTYPLKKLEDEGRQAISPWPVDGGCKGSNQESDLYRDDDAASGLASMDSRHVCAGDEDRISCTSSTSLGEPYSSDMDGSPLTGRPPPLSAAMRQITPQEMKGSTSRVRSLSPLSAFEQCRPMGRTLSLPLPSWKASVDDSCCGFGVDHPSLPPLLCSRTGLARVGPGNVAWHSAGV